MRMWTASGWLLALVSSLPVLAASVTLDALRAGQMALEAAEHDYQRQAARLSTAEAADYQAYIGRLRQRLAIDCQTLRQAGGSVPADIRCPYSEVNPLRSVLIDQRGEQTPAEHTGALDAELQEGLSTFDEQLLREQARVKAQTPRTAAAGMSGGGGAAGGAETGGSGERDSAGSASIGSGEPANGGGAAGSGVEQPAGAAGGPGQPGSATGQPSDIPDGSDDDVVARQLREAAEKETDPALKAKLWEEYRKYKQGTR